MNAKLTDLKNQIHNSSNNNNDDDFKNDNYKNYSECQTKASYNNYNFNINTTIESIKNSYTERYLDDKNFFTKQNYKQEQEIFRKINPNIFNNNDKFIALLKQKNNSYRSLRKKENTNNNIKIKDKSVDDILKINIFEIKNNNNNLDNKDKSSDDILKINNFEIKNFNNNYFNKGKSSDNIFFEKRYINNETNRDKVNSYNIIKKDSTEYEILRNRYGSIGFEDFKQKTRNKYNIKNKKIILFDDKIAKTENNVIFNNKYFDYKNYLKRSESSFSIIPKNNQRRYFYIQKSNNINIIQNKSNKENENEILINKLNQKIIQLEQELQLSKEKIDELQNNHKSKLDDNDYNKWNNLIIEIPNSNSIFQKMNSKNLNINLSYKHSKSEGNIDNNNQLIENKISTININKNFKQKTQIKLNQNKNKFSLLNEPEKLISDIKTNDENTNIKINNNTIYTIDPNNKNNLISFNPNTYKFFVISNFITPEFLQNFEESRKFSKHGNIFLSNSGNFYIVTGKNFNLFYKYDPKNNKKIEKLQDLKNNHCNGVLISYMNKIFCLSGVHTKKVEELNLNNKTEWILNSEMNKERSNFTSLIIDKKFLFACFGYNTPTFEYMESIEYINILDTNSKWKFLNFKNEKNISLYITGAFGIFENNEIIFFGGYDGNLRESNEGCFSLNLGDKFYMENNENVNVEYIRKKNYIKSVKGILKLKQLFFFENNYCFYHKNESTLSNYIWASFDNDFNVHIINGENYEHEIFFYKE